MAAPGSGAQGSTADPDRHVQAQAKLAALLDELHDCVERDGKQRAAAARQNQARAEMLLRKAPLSHGMREIRQLLDVLRGGALLSRKRLAVPAPPLTSETYLGIDDVVYTSAGVFYPERRIALVFRSSTEDDADVSASPWDTGSLCASADICPHLPPAPEAQERRLLFEKTHLPAPFYREYLVKYVAACFGAPEDYLSLGRHRYDDPEGALSARKWQSRVFEVRFRGRIPILHTTLLAAFVPRYAGDRNALSLGVLLEKLKGQSVDVRHYDIPDHLERNVREWIHKRVREEAAR